MKKIQYMLILAGILVIAGLLLSPAHARELTTQDSQNCFFNGRLTMTIADARDDGKSYVDARDSYDDLSLTKHQRAVVQAIVERVYANKKETSVNLGEYAYTTCMKVTAKEP